MVKKPAVFVFAMHGCGACEDYVPRFQQLAGPYRGNLAIGVYDLAKGGRDAMFADRMGVQATPTTIAMDKHGRLRRVVGSIADSAIRTLLNRTSS